MFTVEPGDILLYRKLHTLEVREIDLIERLRDGKQPFYYYHCAVAINARNQIESNGTTVAIRPIEDGTFDALHLPILPEVCQSGIETLRGLVGQKYDWVLIIDDVLRAMTHEFVHLPVSWVKSEERHRKVCSSLVVRYLIAVGWPTELTRNALPEDIYLKLRQYQAN